MDFFNKFSKILLSSITIGLLVGVFVLALDYDFRRGFFERGVRLVNLHQKDVVANLVHQKRYDDVSDRILHYIDVSLWLSSDRSQLFPTIVDMTEFAADRSITHMEREALIPVYRKILDIDPNLYKIRVLLAEALKELNYDDAILNIENAIQLSEVDEKAYRVAIYAALEHHNYNLAQKYCSMYMKSQLGGQYPKLFYSGFAGSGLREFAVKFNNDDQFYLHSGVVLNKKTNYEFITQRTFDFKDLSLFLNVPPGTNIRIDNITLHTNNGKVKINALDLLTTAKSAYILTSESNNDLHLISLGNNTEVINIQSKKNIKNVRKVTITMMFSRSPLASSNVCVKNNAK